MVSWTVLFTRQGQKDARNLASAAPALKQKAQALLELLAHDPCPQPPPDEAPVGERQRGCSRRIHTLHRLVYRLLEEQRIVKALLLCSHDE